MLVDNGSKSTSKGGLVIAALITIAFIIAVLWSSNNDLDDDNCKEWGVEIWDKGKTSWAPIPYKPRNKDDAEHIARQLEGYDIEGGRYYTAKCKEYKK